MNEVLELLKGLGIEYKLLEHPAMFTAEDEEKYYPDGLEGSTTKNLFLRNKKGDKHYLAVVDAHQRVDIAKLAALVGENRLSFGSPERLLKYLGLTPGSVSPFGLINDKDKEVSVIVDAGLLEHELINCHPNINTATVQLKTEDLKRFLAQTGNPVRYLALT